MVVRTIANLVLVLGLDGRRAAASGSNEERLGELFQPGFGIPNYVLAVANKEGVEVELVRKTCTPCRGGVPPLTPEEVGSYLP